MSTLDQRIQNVLQDIENFPQSPAFNTTPMGAASLMDTAQALLREALVELDESAEAIAALRSAVQPVGQSEPDLRPPVIDLIEAERLRQTEAEGWSAAHDDTHTNGELALAAACYAKPEISRRYEHDTDPTWRRPLEWPWCETSWKPTPEDRVRELVKAGALIVAEIERLHRAGEKTEPLPEQDEVSITIHDYYQQNQKVAEVYAGSVGQGPKTSAMTNAEMAEMVYKSSMSVYASRLGGKSFAHQVAQRLLEDEALIASMKNVMDSFAVLRTANLARANEWNPAGDTSMPFALTELAGESGELAEAADALCDDTPGMARLVLAVLARSGKACNEGKKLARQQLGMAGGKQSNQDLAEELADVVICVDLVAHKAGIDDLWGAVINKFNKTSQKHGFKTHLSK